MMHNARNRVASRNRSPKGIATFIAAPSFPLDVAVPMAGGAPIIAIPWPKILSDSSAPPEAALILPEKVKLKPRMTPKGKAKPKSGRQKSSKPKSPIAAAKKAAARTTKPRSKTPPVAPLSDVVPDLVAAIPAINVSIAQNPAEPEQLNAPLPRSQSLAPYRKAGLFDLIGFWLRSKARSVSKALALHPPEPKALRTPWPKPAHQDQMAALQLENARLRSQLEALLVMKQGES